VTISGSAADGAVVVFVSGDDPVVLSL